MSRRTPGSGWFRSDIEGLRAMAVLLILFFHAGVPGFDGGFIGVDVFYVISGFLITRLLLTEYEGSGAISLSSFYARRARRILPAAALVLAATTIASPFLLPPLDVPDVAGDATAAALYVGNYRFAVQATEYLRAEAAPSPLLHYWSLGVEEQFYLLWPALLLATLRRLRRYAGAVLTVIAVLSFAAAVWLTRYQQPWAFFSLPTRAWELLVGAGLAFGAGRLARIGRVPAAAAGWIGIAIVVAASIVLGRATPYPGTASLAPIAGTALLLVAGTSSNGRQTWLQRLLAARPAQALGRISYSLYLWHWPVLTLAAVRLGRSLSWGETAVAVALSFAAAITAYRVIENPIRRAPLFAKRLPALIGGVGLPATVLVVALLASHSATARLDTGAGAASAGSGDFPEAIPANLTPPLASAKTDVAYEHLHVLGCSTGPLGPVVPPDCSFGDKTSDETVVLFGDSHAANWFPALESVARQRQWRLVPLIMNQCTPADFVPWSAQLKRPHVECEQWRAAALARIAQLRPRLVVVASGSRYWVSATIDRLSAQWPPVWRAALRSTLTALKARAEHVALVADTPNLGFKVPSCLSRYPSEVRGCAKLLKKHGAFTYEIDKEVVTDVGVDFIDPIGWICPDELCYPIRGNLLVFADGNHLTMTFGRTLAPRMMAALDAIFARSDGRTS